MPFAYSGSCRCGYKPYPGAVLYKEQGRVWCPKCKEEWPIFLLPPAIAKPAGEAKGEG